jgi:hypothetical protein
MQVEKSSYWEDFDICWCHSMDLTLITFTVHVGLLFKFRFHVEFFDFRYFTALYELIRS